MIKERMLLQELVDLMDTDISVDMMALQRLAQRAEALLEQENPNAVMEVNKEEYNVILGFLEQIIHPRIGYNKSQLKMCQDVIENNEESAREAFCGLEMLVK